MKNSISKRAFVLFLAMLMLLSTACSDNSAADTSAVEAETASAAVETAVTEENTENTSIIETEETNESGYLDDIGEYDCGGYSFNMLSPGPDSMTWANPVIDVTETTGEVLNDAVYNRNRKLEDRLNVKISEEYGSWDIGAGNLRTIVQSGDTTYNIVTMMDRFALSSLSENLLIPYSSLPMVDGTKSYWGNEMLKYSSIGGVNYFLFGDFSLYSYDNVSALLFSKDVLSNAGLENLYDLVNSGKWTIDKFSEYTLAVTMDTNGDGSMTDADSYGFISMPKQVLPSFWIASGCVSITKDESDLPVLNFSDEKLINTINKTFEITRDTGVWYVNDIADDTNTTLEKMFTEGKSLFLDSTFNKIQRLREMDSNFGIIPYPKADESQDTYYTRVSGALVSTVPSSITELEKTGAVLEALASMSRQSVIPAYYEVALKGKYSRDEESQQMLDILFSTRVYDLGDTYWCDDVRDGFIKSAFTNDNRNIVSAAEKNSKALKKKIEKIMKAIQGE